MRSALNPRIRDLCGAAVAVLLVGGALVFFLPENSPHSPKPRLPDTSERVDLRSAEIDSENVRNASRTSTVLPAVATTPGTILITVLCLDADTENPIAGSKVEILVRAEDELYRIARRTDSTGRLRLDPLPAGTYSLTARVPGHLPLTRTLEVETPPVQAVVALKRAHRLTGNVRTTIGEGLDGAQIRAVLIDASRMQTHRALTNSTGDFVLDGLPSGRYRIDAGLADYLQATLEQRVPTERRVQLTLADDPGFEVYLINDDAQPIEGAHLRLLTRTRGIATGRRAAVTNAAGQTRLTGVAPTGGDVRLQIEHSDYGSHQLLLTAGERTKQRVEITLHSPGNVPGSVTDKAGNAVAGAVLSLESSPSTPRYVLRSVTSGGFHFKGVPPGEYRLLASKGSAQTSATCVVKSGSNEPIRVTLPSAQDSTPPTAAPQRPGTLRGRIATVVSVAGATLRLDKTSREGSATSRLYRFSSEDLEFRMRGLEPGHYNLSLVQDGKILAKLDDVVVRTGDANDPVVLQTY